MARNIRFIAQSAVRDGIADGTATAALAMLLHYFGIHVSPEQLSSDFQCSSDNRQIDMSVLIKTAKQYGVQTQSTEVKQQMQLPAILYWRKRFVFAVRQHQSIVLYDPTQGVQAHSIEELLPEIEQIAMGFVLKAEVKPVQLGLPAALRRLRQTSGLLPYFMVASIAAIGILHIAVSILLKLFAENAFSGASSAAIPMAGGILLCVIGILLCSGLTNWMGNHAAAHLAARYESYLAKQDILPEAIRVQCTPLIIDTMQKRGIHAVKTVVSGLLPTVISAAAGILYLLLICGFSLPLGLLAIVLTIILAYQSWQRAYRIVCSEEAAWGADFAAQTIYHASEADRFVFQHWAANMHHASNAYAKYKVWQLTLLPICIVVCGLLSVGCGILTYHRLLPILYLTAIVCHALFCWTNALEKSVACDAALYRWDSFFVRKPAPPCDADGGELEWQNVSMHGGQDNLSEVSFRLHNGKITAIVGDTEGLFGYISTGQIVPENGEIYLGKTSIHLLSHKERQARIIKVCANAGKRGQNVHQALCQYTTLSATESMALSRELGLYDRMQGQPQNTLSDGMYLVAAIGAAIAAQPEVLILDQVLTALDDGLAGCVLRAIRRRNLCCCVVCDEIVLPELIDYVCVLSDFGATYAMNEYRGGEKYEA